MDFRPVRGLVRGVRGSAAFCKVWDWGGLNRSGRGTVWGGNSAASGTRLESLGPGWRDLGGSGRGSLGGLGGGRGCCGKTCFTLRAPRQAGVGGYELCIPKRGPEFFELPKSSSGSNALVSCFVC